MFKLFCSLKILLIWGSFCIFVGENFYGGEHFEQLSKRLYIQ